jgi:hypothetical protein
MVAINEKILDKVKKLYYEEQLSVQDVANKLNVSIDAVFYCMRKNGLKRRKRHESNSINFERSTLSFKIRKLNTEKLRTLKVIGIMLYWGEGGKSDKAMTVDFANSDKNMITLFLRFLREICGVDEKRLRVLPYFYANQEIEENINFWNQITGIDKSQFTKPYIRKDFDINKKHKMPHGLIHIRYADKRLLKLLKNWIEDYKNL